MSEGFSIGKGGIAASAVIIAALIVLAALALYANASARGENEKLNKRLSSFDADKQAEIAELEGGLHSQIAELEAELQKMKAAGETVAESLVVERTDLESQNDDFHDRMVEAEAERDEKRAEAERLAIEVELLAREVGALALPVIPEGVDEGWVTQSLQDCFRRRFPPADGYELTKIRGVVVGFKDLKPASFDEWSSERMSAIHELVHFQSEAMDDKLLAGVAYGCWTIAEKEE